MKGWFKMIKGTTWYGLTSRSPEEYFYKNCHTYDDIKNVIDKKGLRAMHDIKPCIESFITSNENNELFTRDFVETLLKIDTQESREIAMEAISYGISKCNLIDAVDKDLWPMWLNISEIDRAYRTGKVTESAAEILNTSLHSLGEKVAHSISFLDNAKAEYASEIFSHEVDYKKMLDWNNVRESLLSNGSEEAVRIGDYIINLHEEDWSDLAYEGTIALNDNLWFIGMSLQQMNPELGYSIEACVNLLDDMRAYFDEVTPASFEEALINYKASRDLDISNESYAFCLEQLISMEELDGLNDQSVLDRLNASSSENFATNTSSYLTYNIDEWTNPSCKLKNPFLYFIGSAGRDTIRCSDYVSSIARKVNAKLINLDDLFLLNKPNPDTIHPIVRDFFECGTAEKYKNVICPNDSKTFDFSNIDKLHTGGRIIFSYLIDKIIQYNQVDGMKYVLAGIWPLYILGPDNLKDMPVIIAPKESIDSSIEKYGLPSVNVDSIVQIMSTGGITESMLCDQGLLEIAKAGGFIVDDDVMHAMEMAIIDDSIEPANEISSATTPVIKPSIKSSVSAETNDDDKSDKKNSSGKSPFANINDRVADAKRKKEDEKRRRLIDGDSDSGIKTAARKARSNLNKAKNKVSNAYIKYKNKEEWVDGKMSKMLTKANKLLHGDPDGYRRELLEGKNYSPIRMLKLALGGFAIFNVSAIAGILTVIVYMVNRGKFKSDEKNKLLEELRQEIPILEQKIQDAEADGNRDAKYALMRNKANIEMAIKRIKRGDKSKAGLGLNKNLGLNKK